MPRTFRSAVLQGGLFVLSIVIAFALLVRTDLVRRLAYLVEKGRIEALREGLPAADELARHNADARAVAAAVTPAVVQIITEKRVNLANLLSLHDGLGGVVSTNGAADARPDDEKLKRLLKRHEGLRTRDGYGSGFIVDARRGCIVTNDHVIADADAMYVRLADGRLFEAKLLGADPRSDLAVIRIDAEDLHELALADGDSIEVGDAVMSVGNPFGLEGSVSRGIISAKARSNINIHGTEYRGFLQTDAVINPGNSGGPLVNLRGEVVAINTAIATESGHYDGVGFAIPARRIRQVLPALIRGEVVPRGFLGVSITNAPVAGASESEDAGFDPRLREHRGVLVREVLADSPAERYGLRAGDVILSIDDKPLRQTADLIDTVGDSAPGATLAFQVERGDTVEHISVTIGRQPKDFSTRRRLDD